MANNIAEDNISPEGHTQTINLFEVSLLIQEKGGKPAVELRSITTNTEIIKQIVSCAYHNRPILIMPKFTNTMQSLNSCIEKGILYVDNGQFYFTF